MLPRSREGATSFVFAARPQRLLKVGFCLGHLRRIDDGYNEQPNCFRKKCSEDLKNAREIATELCLDGDCREKPSEQTVVLGA